MKEASGLRDGLAEAVASLAINFAEDGEAPDFERLARGIAQSEEIADFLDRNVGTAEGPGSGSGGELQWVCVAQREYEQACTEGWDLFTLQADGRTPIRWGGNACTVCRDGKRRCWDISCHLERKG